MRSSTTYILFHVHHLAVFIHHVTIFINHFTFFKLHCVIFHFYITIGHDLATVSTGHCLFHFFPAPVFHYRHFTILHHHSTFFSHVGTFIRESRSRVTWRRGYFCHGISVHICSGIRRCSGV